MENLTLEKKSVFISYCHKDVNQEWLVKFVNALAQNGIEAIVDIYDLKLGQDLNYFMESMKNEKHSKILVLSGQVYTEKANNRTGGVGVETQIISPDVYKDINSDRVIPICVGKDATTNEVLFPIYLQSKLHIDFSDDNNFSENILKLVRIIHKIPDRVKPKVAEPPKSLLISSVSNNTMEKYRLQKTDKIVELFDEYLNYIKKLTISLDDEQGEIDDLIYDKISESLEYKNLIIKNFDYILLNGFKCESINIIEFIEKFYDLDIEGQNNNSAKTEVIRFLLMEIILYLIERLYKYKKYDIINNILNTTYFSKKDYRYKDGFILYQVQTYLPNLQNRSKRLELNRVSIYADLIVERSNISDLSITKNDIIETDILFSVLSEWYFLAESSYRHWIPYTCIYDEYNSTVKFTNALKSKSRFLSAMELWKVNSIEEFKDRYKKVKDIISKQQNGSRTINVFTEIPSINTLIKEEELFINI